MTLLSVADVHLYYGRSHIIQGVSLRVDEGEVVALLGRNGAGKTSLVHGITGLHPFARGVVQVAGADVSRQPAHRVARHGIGLVPQGRGIFPRLTVDENLRIGEFLGNGRGAHLRTLLFEVFPVLRERLRQRAGTMSGGERQMLAIARALVSLPRLLILDEPTEGLAPSIIDRIEEALEHLLREMRLGVLLIEQNLDFAFALAQRGYVLEKGQIVASGDMREMREESIAKYLVF